MATFFFTTFAGGADLVEATHSASNGIDPWTITVRLCFSTSRDTSRYSTKTWRCNSWRQGRRQMIERTSSSSLRDPFRAHDQSWRSTRPIVGEIRDLPALDLVEARVAMADERAASTVPVRTAEGEAFWARMVMSAMQTSTSVDAALDPLRPDIMEKGQSSRHLPPRQPV